MGPVELLEKIVSIDSVFPHEAELAHFLADELERCGFSVEMQEFAKGRYNVLARRGGEGPSLLLYGHMDTVPAYGYGERDPFRLEEKEGKLYGLGAYDMKAGLAAILNAVQQVSDERPLRIMFVSDEEADSRGCFAVARSGFLKDVSFALATEISDVHDVGEKTRTITLGRRGRVQYEVDVPGRSFHAARQEEGISALTEAAKLAVELERVSNGLPSHPQLSRGSQFVRSFHSESVSLSVPCSAKLLVDRHLVLPEDAESARRGLEQTVAGCYEKGLLREADGRRATVGIVPREVPYLMPYVTPENNPDVSRLSDTIRDTLGVEARFNYGMSVADENLIAMHGVPVASVGPIGGGEHSANEWVSKRSYLELIEVLRTFLFSSSASQPCQTA